MIIATNTKMAGSILLLNEDVLVDGILPYLSLHDVLNLASTCKALYQVANIPAAWHGLYRRTFGVEPIADIANTRSGETPLYKDLFRKRSGANLYGWGDATLGRLGLLSSDIDQSRQAVSALTAAVPIRVDSADNYSITHIEGLGYAMAFLTTNGDIFGIGDILASHGLLNPPAELPFVRQGMRFFQRGFRRPPFVGVNLGHANADSTSDSAGANSAGDDGSEEPAPEAPVLQPMTLSQRVKPKLLSAHETDIKFQQISGGRTLLLALDVSGKHIYAWDQSFGGFGALLQFAYNDDRKYPRQVNKVLAAWGFGAAIVERVGVVAWQTGSHLQRWLASEKDAVKVNSVTLPFTTWTPGKDGEIVDIAGGENFLLLVNRKGELYITSPFQTPLVKPKLLTAFQDRLADQSQTARFIKVYANYKHFAVISDHGDVFFGNPDDHGLVIVHEELQGEGNIVDLAIGDHHFLALNSSGDILVWGLDLGRHGVFGFGRYYMPQDQNQPTIHLTGAPPDTVHEPGNKTRVLRPTKLNLKSKVVAISAGGMQSQAVMIDE